MPNHLLEKFHLFLSLIAAIIVLLACIAAGIPLYHAVSAVVVTIGLFYIIGHFVRYFLVTQVFPPIETEEEAEIIYELESNEDEDEDYDDSTENEPVEDVFLDS